MKRCPPTAPRSPISARRWQAEILASMKISQEVRDAARGSNDTLSSAEIRAAMAKKAEEFRDGGGEIYVHKPAAE